MNSDWILYAVINVFFIASYQFFNQHIRLNVTLLMLWRGLGTACVFLPMLWDIHFPKDPYFYIYLCLIGILVGYLDRSFFKGVERFGAGPISRVQPLYILFALILWWIVDPQSFVVLKANPYKLWGVFGSVALIVYCLFELRKDAISRDVLLHCRGIIVCCAVIDILAKKAFLAAPGFGNVVYFYIFIVSLVSGLVTLGYLFLPSQSENRTFVLEHFLSRHSLVGGGLVVFFVTLAMFFRNTAVILAPNPAYVSAIAGAGPFCIMIFNRISGFPDRANKIAGIGIVVGCLILILCVK